MQRGIAAGLLGLLERRTAFLHCRLYLIGAMMLAALIPALSIPVWTGETLYMAADPVAAAAPAAADAGTPSLPVAVTLFLYALGVLLSFGAMIAQIVRIRRLRHGARTIRAFPTLQTTTFALRTSGRYPAAHGFPRITRPASRPPAESTPDGEIADGLSHT